MLHCVSHIGSLNDVLNNDSSFEVGRGLGFTVECLLPFLVSNGKQFLIKAEELGRRRINCVSTMPAGSHNIADHMIQQTYMSVAMTQFTTSCRKRLTSSSSTHIQDTKSRYCEEPSTSKAKSIEFCSAGLFPLYMIAILLFSSVSCLLLTPW
mmetsp:Transcript_44659/g.107652  ORF Transcript_44659/g.107652 Transcript_44659/m.107652 type:complete len:152 (-) Transcript_44659:3152-3607(-)